MTDLSYVVSTCETLAKHLRRGQLVVLESTTYPGTTEEVMKPILEKSGLVEGVDFALAYSPEREDPGNPNFETSTIPKVVGADSEDARAMAKAAYDKIVTTVMVSNARTAEATKLVENIYRWISISLNLPVILIRICPAELCKDFLKKCRCGSRNLWRARKSCCVV